MAGVSFDAIDDFALSTLAYFHKQKVVDISLPLTKYIAQSMMFTGKKYFPPIGKNMIWNIQIDNDDNIKYSDLFDTDATSIQSLQVQAELPLRKYTTNYSWDIDEELFQTDQTTIVNTLKLRYHSMQNRVAEFREQGLWTAPASTSDKRHNGLPYWIVKDPSTTAEGAFNGIYPTGHTTVAGVDASTNDGFRNWTFGYTTVTEDNLITRIRKAMRNTEFEAPDPGMELKMGPSQCQIFTTESVISSLERLAETRNDNLKSDVMRYYNQVTINGCPVMHVPYLTNNDSTNPLYGVNWGWFRPCGKKGADMRRSAVMTPGNQHTTRVVHFDTWENYACFNRRTQWVGSVA